MSKRVASKHTTTIRYTPQLFLVELFVILLALLILIPLLIMVFGSLKTRAEASLFTLALPTTWQWQNYIEIFEKSNIARAFVNSMIITISSTGICLPATAMCAFVLARRMQRFTNTIYFLFILGIIVPVSIIPTIVLMQTLRMYGTFPSVILLYIAINSPWSVFIFTGFMKNIPRDIEEAAIIDGCGAYSLFFRVVFPLLQPAFVTNAIIISMGVWNDFMLPLYFFNTARKWTMPLMVYNFFGQYYRDWNLVFADLVVTALPILILYLLGQKFIITGMTAGAVNGLVGMDRNIPNSNSTPMAASRYASALLPPKARAVCG